MVDWLQEVRLGAVGIALNPAAFTYAGYPILDAIKMVDCPVIEVHISNIHRREAEWRSKSIMTQVVTGIISGLGVHGYELAVQHLLQRHAAEREVKPTHARFGVLALITFATMLNYVDRSVMGVAQPSLVRGARDRPRADGVDLLGVLVDVCARADSRRARSRQARRRV